MRRDETRRDKMVLDEKGRNETKYDDRRQEKRLSKAR